MSEASSPQQPIATWNPARGVWERNQALFCGHLEPWLETWPTSGMTVAGQLYVLPTLEPATVEPESSSSPNLLTPRAQAREHLNWREDYHYNLEEFVGHQQAGTLRSLLPTPTSQAAKHGSLAPIELEGNRRMDESNLWVVLPRLTLSTSDPTPTPSTDTPEQ